MSRHLSTALLKNASAILDIKKQSFLTSEIKQAIEETDKVFLLRYSFDYVNLLHCIKLNISNPMAFPFDYLDAKYNLYVSKGTFGKLKLEYSNILLKKTNILKE